MTIFGVPCLPHFSEPVYNIQLFHITHNTLKIYLQNHKRDTDAVMLIFINEAVIIRKFQFL